MRQHTFEVKSLSELKEYDSNSRTHSPEQIKQVERSIANFGFTNPILVDEGLCIIAGHCRATAAANLGLVHVPCILIQGLNQHEKAALVIADNKLAENAGWNYDALKSELGFLNDFDFDLSLTGFDGDELADLLNISDEPNDLDDTYTQNISAPTYEPKNEKPEVLDLFDRDKKKRLVKKIKSSSISEKEKEFLIEAASRHTVFDFSKVADYYAHSPIEVQELMEESALVIIDYNKAIENGFVQISKDLEGQALDE